MKENAQKVLERIVVFFTISSFVLASMMIISAIIEANSKIEDNYIDIFTYGMTLFSGLIYVLVLQIFVTEKTKSGVHVIFLVFYLIFELIFCFLCGAYNAPYVLIPVTIVHYLLEAFMNEVFVFHDYFLYENDKRKGKELIEYLFHNRFVAADFAAKRKKVQGYLFTLGALMLVFIVLGFILAGGITLFTAIFTLIFYFFLFISFWILGFFNRESFYAFLGFNDISKDLKLNFKYCLIIFLFAGIFAFALSSNKALIKVDYLAENFEKIQYQTPSQLPQEPEYMDFSFDMPDFSAFIQEPKPSTIPFELIFKIIKIISLVICSVFLLVFLIKPFFSENWKNYWRERKMVKFMKRFFDGLRDLFSLFFSNKKDSSDYVKVEGDSFKKEIEKFLKRSKKSKDKVAEVDRLTKRFITLIEWGAKREINYKSNLTPAEYTKLLEAYLADFTDKSLVQEAKNCGWLFEKALYDKELLSKEEEKLYNNAIDLILSSGAKK